ncbi:MAG TPA: hypothetical protein VFV87_09705 [Pirellulaceae bacterium]|nr:hypothetical protein [Pirellulaceae bacterium]
MIAAVAALVAIGLGADQLRKVVDALRMSGLGAILQLETDIHARKQRVVESATEILRANLDLETEPNQIRKQRIEQEILILSKKHDAFTEHWLNSADRLAFVILYCLRKRYFRDRDWKSEYYAYMKDLVDSNPEWFGTHTDYNNVLKLIAKWERPPRRR